MKQSKKPVLYIVVPCYNEEDVLKETSSRLLSKINSMIKNQAISDNSAIVFVDDGSFDNTWDIIKSLNKGNSHIYGLQLSTNRGHQNALLAGLLEFKNNCDCIISMDADLQDDIEAIDDFIIKFKEGYEVIYGVRNSRKKDSFFKKHTALFFYKLMKTLGVDIKYNHADYRLLSKRAINSLSEFKEVNLFLRGIVPIIGFNSTDVFYERKSRFAGESKYPLKKMLKFAWEGITSFSVVPLKLVSAAGFIISGFSLLAMIYVFASKIFGDAVSGWSSLLISIWFLGGVQLIAVGVLGEYIGKIYQETKQRPKYFIKEKLMND